MRYESSHLQLSRKGGRKRNMLYCFNHDRVQCDVIMKVSHISHHYRLSRKIDLFITELLKSYNYKSYISSVRMLRAGIDTIEPIAYWTYKPSRFRRKSYLLYKKVESELTAAELCNKIIFSETANKDLLIRAVVDRCVSIVQNIHAANIRHDDPHGNNILTNIKNRDVDTLDEVKINNARFTLIDNDRCSFARTVIPGLKRFFDIRCLVRFQICEIPQQELLRRYLGEKYSIYWWYVFIFWRSGGFSIHKRLGSLFKGLLTTSRLVL